MGPDTREVSETSEARDVRALVGVAREASGRSVHARSRKPTGGVYSGPAGRNELRTHCLRGSKPEGPGVLSEGYLTRGTGDRYGAKAPRRRHTLYLGRRATSQAMAVAIPSNSSGRSRERTIDRGAWRHATASRQLLDRGLTSWRGPTRPAPSPRGRRRQRHAASPSRATERSCRKARRPD